MTRRGVSEREVDVAVVGEVSIRYATLGHGFPVLLLAPGGMSSTMDAWERAPFDPFAELAGELRLVAMDQRHTALTPAPLETEDPWGSYAADQLDLMTYLGHERFHVLGMCIGCAFGLKLALEAPERVAAGVLLQPIGIVDESRELFESMWHDWRDELLARRPELHPAEVDAFGTEMWRQQGFVGSVTRDDVRSLTTPLLVMPGVDPAHPGAIGREIASLAPHAERWEPWRETPEQISATVVRVRDFLREHAA